MKAIMLMFDSLNRHMLSPYGCEWTKTPNFQRLAERTVTFDNSYVGSMPCMPSRREIHTGRYNFLHRGWGPLEPFDDSMPEMLRQANISSHLISDHYHYWEDGGCTYHTKYHTWQAFRGQEGDLWMPHLTEDYAHPESMNDRVRGRHGSWEAYRVRQDWVNRHYMDREELMPQVKTMTAGLEFLETNAQADDWFLHIETFDPHEPYHVAQRFLDLYEDDWAGPHFDWPPYHGVDDETRPAVEHMRIVNAALHSMCDHYLGKVLDAMDAHNLWDDTMLIVCTDHGFLLGEHDCWAKCWAPFYQEVAHQPLFIWDPRCPQAAGQRRRSLVQTIDWAPTLLEYFGLTPTDDMTGRPLRETLANDTPVREAGLFGLFGAHVNITDGRYVYMRAPADKRNTPLCEYTHMPTHMASPFHVTELQRMQELAEPFSFTKGCKTMKIPHPPAGGEGFRWPTMLFDVQADPQQQTPLDDPAVEQRLIEQMRELMAAHDAPPEQYERLGLSLP